MSVRRRRGRPSTYELRRLGLSRLFYEMTQDEMDLRTSNVGDMAARAVMTDALEERGLHRLALTLRRWPPDKRLSGSLFHQKLRRAIFGPEQRQSYFTEKPKRRVLLALVGHPGQVWLRVHRWHTEDSGGYPYLLERPLGNFSTNFLVVARNMEDALEAAQERWPNWFLDEEGEPEEDVHVERARRSDWGRVVDYDTAFVRGVGLVRFHR